jgi:hypothetical protein
MMRHRKALIKLLFVICIITISYNAGWAPLAGLLAVQILQKSCNFLLLGSCAPIFK